MTAKPFCSRCIPIKLTSYPICFYSTLHLPQSHSNFSCGHFKCTLFFSKYVFLLKVFSLCKGRTLYLCFLMVPLSLLYKTFLCPLLTYASSRWYLFFALPTLSSWNAFHQVAGRAITGCISSFSIPLLIYEASLPSLRVTLTHFAMSSYEGALCIPTSYLILGLAKLGVKPRLSRSS